MNSAYRLLQALLLTLWPPAIWASTQVRITLDSTFDGIAPVVWIIVLSIATMGALTSLLHRLKTDTPKSMIPYVISHMLMGWFAGVVTFFFLEGWEVPDLVEIPCIGIAAYMGSRLVDTVSDRFIDWAIARLGAMKAEPPK